MRTMKSPTELTPPPSPHLAWLGRSKPHDKVLPPGVARAILSRPVLIEEYPDGAVLGFASDGDTLTPYRHQKLLDPATHPQFHSLWAWLAEREEPIVRRIGTRLMLFGAWCSATHAVRHDRLPDWFILTEVIESETGKTWTADRRNALAKELSLATPGELARTKTDVASLTERLPTPSALGAGPVAGLIVRLEQGDHLVERAVLVRQEVADAPDEPSARKSLERNTLAE